MLYFYCCDVLVKGKKSAQTENCLECNKRITEIEEIKKVQEEIRHEIFKQLSQETPLSLEDISLLFTAFNPL